MSAVKVPPAALAVRAETDVHDDACVPAEGSEIQMAEAIQVAPFPMAESGRTGVQKPLCFTHLGRKPLLMRHPDMGDVEALLGPLLLRVGFDGKAQ